MIALLLALAVQQTQPQPPLSVDVKPAEWADPVQDAENVGDPLTVERLYKRAGCLIDASGDKVAATLAKDYRSAEYKRAFGVIFQNNASCFGRRGSSATPSLTLTGAMAELLLARDKTALNVRLARAASGPAPQPFSVPESAAICTVRSMPDQVAAWLGTKPGSAESLAAAKPVEAIFNRCGGGETKTKLSTPRLRSLMALAALRSTNTGGSAATRN